MQLLKLDNQVWLQLGEETGALKDVLIDLTSCLCIQFTDSLGDEAG